MPQTLRDVLAKVAKKLNRGEEDIEPIVDTLRKNWYEDLDSLAGLSEVDLQGLGVPLRFAKELASLGVLSGGGCGGGSDGPPAPPLDSDRGAPAGKGKDFGDRRPVKGKGKEKRGPPPRYEERVERVVDRVDRMDRDVADRGKGKGKVAKGKGGKPREGPYEREFNDRFEKLIYVETDDTEEAFPWKKLIVGDNGKNTKHITKLTNTHIALKGRGTNSGAEDSQMHLRISGDDKCREEDFHKAVDMCEDLLQTVYEQFAEWAEANGGQEAHHFGDTGRYDDFRRKGKGKGKGKRKWDDGWKRSDGRRGWDDHGPPKRHRMD